MFPQRAMMPSHPFPDNMNKKGSCCSRQGTPRKPKDHIHGRSDAELCCCVCRPDQSCWIFEPTWETELNRQVYFTWSFAILATVIFVPCLWFQYGAYTFLMLIGVIPSACLLGSMASCLSFNCCPIHVWTPNELPGQPCESAQSSDHSDPEKQAP